LAISIFGHFFCPFLKIPKYFAQKILEKRINWEKDLKKYILYFGKGLKENYNIYFGKGLKEHFKVSRSKLL